MPSSKGKHIAFDGASRTLIDGPFTETSEMVAGFWLWEVEDMDEAVAWMRRCPSPMPGSSGTEIRPLGEMTNLEQSLMPETRENRYRVRKKLSSA